MVDYFGQFMNKRAYTEDTFINNRNFVKRYIVNSDKVGKYLHDLPRDTPIGLMSDYDADGLFSGVVGFLCLTLFGFTNVRIAPRQVMNGYKFTRADVDNLGNIAVMITSDVGITCFDAISYARSKGIFTIVTDHHHPVENTRYDFADIIVDPMFDTCYKTLNVCGAFTLWQIFDWYFSEYGHEFANPVMIYNDLVLIRHLAAVATVADSMPIRRVNSYVVSEMIHFFNYILPPNFNLDIVRGIANHPVLQNVYLNLCNFLRMAVGDYYTSFSMTTLGYTFIPIVNSIKRMDYSIDIFYNMLFGDALTSESCAEIMIQLNEQRQQFVREIFEECYIRGYDCQMYAPMIYITRGNPGILGLIAQKIITITDMPVVVLNDNLRYDEEFGDECYTGSVRSPSWYCFFSNMRANMPHAVRCEGHETACGIVVRKSFMNEFYNFLMQDIERFRLSDLVPNTRQAVLDQYDVCCDYDENFIDFKEDLEYFYSEIKRHGPFGKGFSEPQIIFKFSSQYGKKTLLSEYTIVDDNGNPVVDENGRNQKGFKHIKINLTEGLDVLLWNTTEDELLKSMEGDTIFITGTFAESYFRGERSLNIYASPVFNGTEAGSVMESSFFVRQS